MSEIKDAEGIIRQSQAVLGLEMQVPVAESVQSFDRLAKRDGACLAEANKNITYRGTSAVARRLLADAIEADTGIERKKVAKGIKVVKDEDGNEVEEEVLDWAPEHGTEKKYIESVLAEKECEITAFSHLVADIEAQLVFDPSETVRESKPKKLPKNIVDAVATLLEQPEDVINNICAKLSEELGITVQPEEKSLGAAIHLREKKKDLAQKLQAELLG